MRCKLEDALKLYNQLLEDMRKQQQQNQSFVSTSSLQVGDRGLGWIAHHAGRIHLRLGHLTSPLSTLPWKPPLFDLRTLDFIDAWLKKVV